METDITLLVSYVVSNASWSSAYDVRVLPVTKEMKVGPNSIMNVLGSVVCRTVGKVSSEPLRARLGPGEGRPCSFSSVG